VCYRRLCCCPAAIAAENAESREGEEPALGSNEPAGRVLPGVYQRGAEWNDAVRYLPDNHPIRVIFRNPDAVKQEPDNARICDAIGGGIAVEGAELKREGSTSGWRYHDRVAYLISASAAPRGRGRRRTSLVRGQIPLDVLGRPPIAPNASYAALVRRFRHNRSIQVLVHRIGNHIHPRLGLRIAKNHIARPVIAHVRQITRMSAAIKLDMP